MSTCKVEGPSSCSMYQCQVGVCGIEQDKFSQWGMSLQCHRAGDRATFVSRETGISGNFVGRIQGAKGPFDLQFLTWDFS